MKPGDWVKQRFQVERLAGSGAMGAVYLARDITTNRRVALKVLHGHRLEHAARFEREGHALASLSHPAIVRYVAHGTDDAGDPFLAMDWIEGEALSERLSRGRLSLWETRMLGHRIADALALVHRAGVVHRDLKPSNVMLAGGAIDGAILVDFGIAHLSDRTRLTGTGAMLGTVGYMPPEQARGEVGLDPRADVYALGAMLFRALTGQMPFGKGEALTVLMAQATEEPPRLRAMLDGVPPALDDLVARMLSRAPASRPQDAAHVLHELSRIDISQAPHGPLSQRHSGEEAPPGYRAPAITLPDDGGHQAISGFAMHPPSTLGPAAHTVPGPAPPSPQGGTIAELARSKLVVGLAALVVVLGVGAIFMVSWAARSGAFGGAIAGGDCPAELCHAFPVDNPAALEPAAIYPRVKAMALDVDPTAQLVVFGTDAAVANGKIDLSRTKLHFSYRTAGGRGLVASLALSGSQTMLRWTFQGQGSSLSTIHPVADPRCTLEKVWAKAKRDFDTDSVALSYVAIAPEWKATWILRDPQVPSRITTIPDESCPR